MNDTFLGWQSYPLLFTCPWCDETCDVDYAYEHDHCEPIEKEEEEEL